MKRKLKLLLLLTSGFIIAFLLAELYLRLFDPQITYANFLLPYDFHCFIKNDFYPLGLKPGSKCLLKSNSNAFDPVYIYTNSLGFRSPEITMPKPSGTLRILFIGDSLTAGWGVDEDAPYPRV